jgi:hypothetical protein
MTQTHNEASGTTIPPYIPQFVMADLVRATPYIYWGSAQGALAKDRSKMRSSSRCRAR